MFITPFSKGVNNVYKWDDMASNLIVAKKPANLQIKIFNKNFLSFEDEFVGRGETEIDNLGYLNMPLFNERNCYIGTVRLGVELYQ